MKTYKWRDEKQNSYFKAYSYEERINPSTLEIQQKGESSRVEAGRFSLESNKIKFH